MLIIACPEETGMITGACASSAGRRDSQNLLDILDQTLINLASNDILIGEITADAGYSSGEALAYLEKKGIEAWIPNFGQYIPEREGFYYNKEQDRYECVKAGGNQAYLPFKGERTDSKGYTKKTYRSSESDCKNCPLRVSCCGVKTKFKKIDDSIYKPYYDRMHAKLRGNPTYAKRISKIRSKTVEPVLGTLINFINMKKINSRGMSQANKHVLMSALTYNLKKYLKFDRKQVKTKPMALRAGIFTLSKDLFSNILSILKPKSHYSLG